MSVALALAYGSLVGVSGTGMRRPRALTAVAARPVPDIADTVVMPPLAACLGDPTPDIQVAGDWPEWGALERVLAAAAYLALPSTGRHRRPRRYRGRRRAPHRGGGRW